MNVDPKQPRFDVGEAVRLRPSARVRIVDIPLEEAIAHPMQATVTQVLRHRHTRHTVYNLIAAGRTLPLVAEQDLEPEALPLGSRVRILRGPNAGQDWWVGLMVSTVGGSIEVMEPAPGMVHAEPTPDMGCSAFARDNLEEIARPAYKGYAEFRGADVLRVLQSPAAQEGLCLAHEHTGLELFAGWGSEQVLVRPVDWQGPWGPGDGGDDWGEDLTLADFPSVSPDDRVRIHMDAGSMEIAVVHSEKMDAATTTAV